MSSSCGSTLQPRYAQRSVEQGTTRHFLIATSQGYGPYIDRGQIGKALSEAGRVATQSYVVRACAGASNIGWLIYFNLNVGFQSGACHSQT